MKLVFVEIRLSKMLPGQIGVFAVRDLLADHVIYDEFSSDSGELMPWSCYEILDIKTKSFVDRYCVGTPEGFWYPIDPSLIPIVYHLNHSCSPNCGFDVEGRLLTIRNVRADEELCYDYGFVESNPEFFLQCSCGYPQCRGNVTGNDWKDPAFQKKNAGWMLPELRAK